MGWKGCKFHLFPFAIHPSLVSSDTCPVFLLSCLYVCFLLCLFFGLSVCLPPPPPSLLARISRVCPVIALAHSLSRMFSPPGFVNRARRVVPRLHMCQVLLINRGSRVLWSQSGFPDTFLIHSKNKQITYLHQGLCLPSVHINTISSSKFSNSESLCPAPPAT